MLFVLKCGIERIYFIGEQNRRHVEEKNRLNRTIETLEAENQAYADAMGSILDQNQKRKMLKKIKKIKKFSARAMCLGQALASIGKSRYKLVRRLLKPLNLPSLRSVQRMRAQVKMKPGIQEIGFRLLSETVSDDRLLTLDAIDKLAILVIDETCIDDKIVYAEDLGRLMTKNKVNVVEVKSLTGAFNQIVYANFNDDFGRETFCDIVERLKNIGITTIAFTGDNGTQNQNLWQELDVSYQNPCFEHLGMKIFAFSDMSHNLKLLRNHVVMRRFRTISFNPATSAGSVETEIYPRQVLELLVQDEHNVLLAEHVYLDNDLKSGSRKLQDVGLALKVVNRKVSEELRLRGHTGESEIISLGSEYFEIFNHTDKDFLCFANKERIEARLRAIAEYFSNLRMTKPDNKAFHDVLIPFQKGIIMSCRALLNMMEHLTQVFGPEWRFPSHKLSSDSIECKFSRLKSHYGAKPNPVLFMLKLKIMILCGFAGPSSSINVPFTASRDGTDEECEEQMNFSDLLDEVVTDINLNEDEQLDQETLEELQRIENRDGEINLEFEALNDAENVHAVVDHFFLNSDDDEFFRVRAQSFLIAKIEWVLAESAIEYRYEDLQKYIKKKMHEKAAQLRLQRSKQDNEEPDGLRAAQESSLDNDNTMYYSFNE